VEIIISSNNRDKIKEIREIIQIDGVTLRTLAEFPDAPEVIEDRNTLYGNALKKAQMIFDFTGIPTVADDTGLEVDALDGRPGVYSARYAGENASYKDNVEKLLSEMEKVPDEKRLARFRTTAVFYHPDKTISAEGEVWGKILTEPRGAKVFGYDPIFYIENKGKTFDQMDGAGKNLISHRGKAFRKLYEKMKIEIHNLNK